MDAIDLDELTFDVEFTGAVEGEIIQIDSTQELIDVESNVPGDGVPIPRSEVIINNDAEEGNNDAKEGEKLEDYDLVGVVVKSEEEAYQMYNDYAFKLGFSVRKSKMKRRADGSLSMRRYLCSQAGLKEQKTKPDVSFTKLDVRSNCEAQVQFQIDKDGTWIVSKHVKEHSHALCPPSASHLLRSHRRINRNHIVYLEELKKGGVGVADGYRVLKNQSGGSPCLGFGLRDAYNALNNPKILDGTDSSRLLDMFRHRQATEKDFFFDFQLDSQSRLCSFFWRDGRMLEDYKLFGDLVVHDTTYRTNKYDMICGPFVGMNHHGLNVMFGCGFLMNETIESFEWLFKTFLRAMFVFPITIMTDQSAAMAAAIAKIFPHSRHRLCIWHIGENSKNHIMALRIREGFMDDFNYLLKCCDSIAEFETKWLDLTSKYDCASNKWLLRLYGIKEKWCPAFNKGYFSGGALSSQRSESTNQALSKKLSKTSGLCDFYHCFEGVVAEWRSNEKAQDVACLIGKRTMSADEPQMLLHASEVYTLKAYDIFEHEYKKGSTSFQLLVSADSYAVTYHVWREGHEKIKHTVCYELIGKSVSCTCKLFTEIGILCSHSLRIMNIHCVSTIPEFYILDRWRKVVVKDRFMDSAVPSLTSRSEDLTASSLWRTQASRKALNLISTCENNREAQLSWDTGFQSIREDVIRVVGSVTDEGCLDDKSSRSDIVENPESTSLKYTRRRRVKPTMEKICNKIRGGKKKSKTAELKDKMAVRNLKDDDGGYVVHPVSGGQRLEVLSPNTSSRFHSVLYDSVP